jgi:hypothetical protein
MFTCPSNFVLLKAKFRAAQALTEFYKHYYVTSYFLEFSIHSITPLIDSGKSIQVWVRVRVRVLERSWDL